MDDLFFKDGQKAFSCRVSGILINGNNILMQYNGDNKKLMFIGGHLKHGEKSDNALIRELREEGNIEINCEQFLGWYDFCFEWKNMHTYQLCAFYLVTSPKLTLDNLNNNCLDQLNDFTFNSNLIWVKRTEIIDKTIYPKQLLIKLDQMLNGKLLT